MQGLAYLFIGTILIGCVTDGVKSNWWPHRLPEVLLFSNWTGRYFLLGSWWGNLEGDLSHWDTWGG